MPDNRTTRFTMRLSPQERQAMTIIAQSEGLSNSSALRRILRLSIIEAAPLGIFPKTLLTDLNIHVPQNTKNTI